MQYITSIAVCCMFANIVRLKLLDIYPIVRTHGFSIRYTVDSGVTERKPVDS